MDRDELFNAMCNMTEREKTNLLAAIFGYVNGMSKKKYVMNPDDILEIIETRVKGEDIFVPFPRS